VTFSIIKKPRQWVREGKKREREGEREGERERERDLHNLRLAER
jgi:hypothetical protein